MRSDTQPFCRPCPAWPSRLPPATCKPNRAADPAQGSTPALLTLAVESPSGERTVEVMLDNAGAPVSVKVRRQLAARS